VIACAESHLRIYHAALREGVPALIFEDDTRLFAPAEEFHAALAEAPDGWDLIHFHGPAHYDGIVERQEGHTERLRALRTVGFGAVAYAVSPAGIYKIMRAAYPLDRPIDVTIREIPNLRAFRTAKPFASRDGLFSSELR
jgi:GR25 family glycosyltransferase involved in LPS biosynthesis